MPDKIIFQDERITITAEDILKAYYNCSADIEEYVLTKFGVDPYDLPEDCDCDELDDEVDDYILNNAEEIWERFQDDLLAEILEEAENK